MILNFFKIIPQTFIFCKEFFYTVELSLNVTLLQWLINKEALR